jgi:ketosteroid isomerase-like protein
MRSRIVTVALAGALAAACAHGGPAPAPAPAAAAPKDVVAAVRSVLEQWRQAYEVRSEDALAKLYAHDPALVVVLEGTPLVGWPAVEAALKDRVARADEIHVRLADVRVVDLAPTAAVVTAGLTREVKAGATTVTERGTLTLALRKDADAWLIVAEHYSYKHV